MISFLLLLTVSKVFYLPDLSIKIRESVIKSNSFISFEIQENS